MARRFQFRLEQILNLRKQLEEVRIRELAQARARLLQIEEEIQQHVREEDDFLGFFKEFEKQGNFDSNQAIVYYEYRDWLIRREKEYRHREKNEKTEVEKRRQITVKASREQATIGQFERERMNENIKEVTAEEQKFLDEISSIAFVRR